MYDGVGVQVLRGDHRADHLGPDLVAERLQRDLLGIVERGEYLLGIMCEGVKTQCNGGY